MLEAAIRKDAYSVFSDIIVPHNAPLNPGAPSPGWQKCSATFRKIATKVSFSTTARCFARGQPRRVNCIQIHTRGRWTLWGVDCRFIGDSGLDRRPALWGGGDSCSVPAFTVCIWVARGHASRDILTSGERRGGCGLARRQDSKLPLFRMATQAAQALQRLQAPEPASA
jgi:hypothetical protein